MDELSSILSKENKVVVKFKYDIEIDFPEFIKIEANKKISLPIFLVDFLIKNGHCSYEEIMKPELKKEFNAKASCVDIGSMYFYQNIIELDENIEYGQNVFLERMKDFLDLVIKNDISEDDFASMDVTEKSIIKEARNTFHIFNK
ncbi:hypothetical protein DMUE_2219 [Dictyocoela muelleri]|nr:hypothetical protein DMUE_2219 [Dictyocoela muelleri]